MFKVLVEGCEPTRGSKYSACVDLYSSEDVTIGAGETKVIGLGVAIDEEFIRNMVDEYHGYSNDLRSGANATIDKDYAKFCKETHEKNFEKFCRTKYMQLMLRSSLGKKGLVLPNGVGIIDLDYKDEIKMIVHNQLAIQKMEMHVKDEPNRQILTLQQNREKSCVVKKGDKIAQITLLEHKCYLFGVDTDKERNGGFGSTGE